MNYKPEEIASRYEGIARHKTQRPFYVVLCLSILGGAYIALAGVGAHTVAALFPDAGVAKLISSLLFPAGLGMLLIAGGELFTGNCMLTLAVCRRCASVGALLRNWGTVYLGNFLGAIVIAWLAVYARRSDPAFLQAAINAALSHTSLAWGEAFVRAILCNILVCAAVWMSYATDSVTGKIVAIYFPVALFVLCGTEHCVANAFYFSAGLFAGGYSAAALPQIITGNLIPVTLGNIVGGGVLYSGLLWLSLFRQQKSTAPDGSGAED